MEAKTQLLIPPKNEENDVRDEHFHVLAVDDSVIERKMLEKLLTISSYHVTCVESGDKALEFLGLVNCHSSSVINSDDHNNHDHNDGDDHNDDNDDDDDGDHSHDNDDEDSMIFSSLPLPDDNAHQEQEGQGTRVNLIMTDYSMPGMSGYDLLKRVKESSWKDVPVVVMSSENVPSRIHMCLEEGAEEFLLKPVRLSDLKKLQPRILKPTSTSTTTQPRTCSFCCDRSANSNLLAANNIENNNNSKDEIAIGDNHGDYTSKSNQGKDEENTQFKNEMEQFAKSSKLDQLVM